MIEGFKCQQRLRRQGNQSLLEFLFGGDRRAVDPFEPPVHIGAGFGVMRAPTSGIGDPGIGQFAKRSFHPGSRQPQQHRTRLQVIGETFLHRIPQVLGRRPALIVAAGQFEHRAAVLAEPETANGKRRSACFIPLGGRVGEGPVQDADRPRQELLRLGQRGNLGGAPLAAPPGASPAAAEGRMVVFDLVELQLLELRNEKTGVHRLDFVLVIRHPIDDPGPENLVLGRAVQRTPQIATGQETVVLLQCCSTPLRWEGGYLGELTFPVTFANVSPGMQMSGICVAQRVAARAAKQGCEPGGSLRGRSAMPV